MNDAIYVLALVDVAEDAVVRADEIIVVGHHQDGAATRPHARINDDYVKSHFRKIRIATKQSECRRIDVVRRNLMRQVYDLGGRVERIDHALHCWHEVISLAEIRCQRYKRSSVGHLFLHQSGILRKGRRHSISVGNSFQDKT